ncbi:MAG: T9SS type A sorting domain-containing protein, partial [Bacteroidetes bacterium]|nr:T9SS type A sorting domain-containing protein [Bacteroidota bacterium]
NTIKPFIPNYGNTISYYFIDDVFLYEVDSTSGISEEEAMAGNAVLAPNPASDQVRLDFPMIMKQDYLLEVYGLPGNTIFSQPLQGGRNSYSFSVTSLPEGLYLYRIYCGKRVVKVGKLVVQR